MQYINTAALNNTASMPKPNATTNGVIGVMQGSVSVGASQAISDRVQHCVGQILHSRKLGAVTRLLRSQNELKSLVSKWGSIELDSVCLKAGVQSYELF